MAGTPPAALSGATVGNIAEAHTEALTHLLLHARRVLSSLSLEYPAGEMKEAFTAAGFKERRTLLWMRAEPATQPNSPRS